MSQRTNRRTKIANEIEKEIRIRNKYLLESEYKTGVIVGLKVAKELIYGKRVR